MTRSGGNLPAGRGSLARPLRLLLLCLLTAGVPAMAAPKPAPGHADLVEYYNPETPPARGPAYAPVTIEVFFVPGPSMPTAALRLLQQLVERHPTRIRLVYRIMKSNTSVQVPKAALEAHAEGKFFEMLDEFSKLHALPTTEQLLELARKVGVDPQRVALAIQPEPYRALLEANQQRSDRLHAGSPPSVLFNSKPTEVGIAGFTAAKLDHEYQTAYDRAIDKLDRGVTADQLAEAFDTEAMHSAQPPVRTSGLRDDDPDRSPFDHPLAMPPLPLDGLPLFGKPGGGAAVPVIVLCRPNDSTCGALLRGLESEIGLYPDDVRLVWAPWFDVGRDHAADLTLLGDAALCAEVVGANQGEHELTTSPGWLWVREMYVQSGRNYKKLTPEKLIDAVAAKLDIDARALSACRASMASTTLEWIAAARHAGIPHSSTVVVIGGRIYDGLTNPMVIKELIEAELAPGILGSFPQWHTGK